MTGLSSSVYTRAAAVGTWYRCLRKFPAPHAAAGARYLSQGHFDRLPKKTCCLRRGIRRPPKVVCCPIHLAHSGQSYERHNMTCLTAKEENSHVMQPDRDLRHPCVRMFWRREHSILPRPFAGRSRNPSRKRRVRYRIEPGIRKPRSIRRLDQAQGWEPITCEGFCLARTEAQACCLVSPCSPSPQQSQAIASPLAICMQCL